MYLKNIVIKNIGPIEELSVELPFKENGEPKPIIFVGENGTGKTILQSQIIDGLFEIGGKIFDDIQKKESLGYEYYKISGPINLRINETKGFSLLRFKDKEGILLDYYDKVGKLSTDDFKVYINDFSLTLTEENKQTTNLEPARKTKLENEWVTGVHFYQPAYRYEEPFWKNEAYVDNINPKDQWRFSGKLGKDLEIVSSLKENKAFLLDLVLDYLNKVDNQGELLTWNSINTILKTSKKRNDLRFGIGPRGGSRVSIVKTNTDGETFEKPILKSIDYMSLGELNLINIFINIVRQGDRSNKEMGQIEGIVLIDEIDVHLHTDLQYSVLPVLLQMFPKIQFIITTHSPLFLLGMKNTFGEDGFEIRDMPTGEQITTERFSEFENAYEVLKETIRFEDEIKTRIIANNKPIVYLEGETDPLYINKAKEYFGVELDVEFQWIGEKDSSNNNNFFSGESSLTHAKDFLKANFNYPKHKTIFLYDCDVKEKKEVSNFNEDIGDLVFVRRVPKQHENPIEKGIENLFGNETIKKVRNENKKLIKKRTQEDDNGKEIESFYVSDNQKINLCNWICKNGTKDDFKNFEKIFEIIEAIIKQ